MSEKEIEKLCNEICNQHRGGSKTEEWKSLRSLRNICGLRTCACPALTPSQNLSRLLEVLHQDQSVLSLPVGLAIINNCDSIGLEKHCNQVLERILLDTMTMSHSEEKNKFLRKLWGYSGLKEFKITTIEDFIAHESSFLEEDILHVFEESSKTNHQTPALKTVNYERIVSWSSNSPRIFCAVTSIFNILLQRVANLFSSYNIGISIVSQFICNVKLKCIANGRDFVLLYPLEFHSLVSVLDISPSYFPESSAVRSSVNIITAVQLIKQSLMNKPVQTLCLLTHFPAWLPYINR